MPHKDIYAQEDNNCPCYFFFSFASLYGQKLDLENA